MKRFTTLVAGLTLAVLTFGCGSDANDNKTSTNTNTVVVTNTNARANVNANTNANANKDAFNANISQEEYDKDKETFGQKAKDMGEKVGSGLTDGWIWAKTRGALLAADDLDEAGINVDVNNAVITLRGTVPSQDQVKKADTVAKGVGGNKGVQNQLKVSASGNTNASAKSASK